MAATHALGACAERRVGSSPTLSTIKYRAGGRVVDCSRLEIWRLETVRGFESHPALHKFNQCCKNTTQFS